MGDFIKDLNIIDFLGMFLPGAFIVLLFGYEYNIWMVLGAYFADDAGVGVKTTILLISGYAVGMLLHELGDLIEKILWHIPALDPRTYAALRTGFWVENIPTTADALDDTGTTKKKIGWRCVQLKEFGCCILAGGSAVYPLHSLLFSASQGGKNGWVWVFCATLCIIPPVIAQMVYIHWIAKDSHIPAALSWIHKNDAEFFRHASQTKDALRKRTLFDGFRTMARNLLIAFLLIGMYARFMKGNISDILGEVIKYPPLVVSICVILATLLLRYYHFSYLRFKYCYEDNMHTVQGEEEKVEESALSPK